ncbi:MAG: polyhydroxyalkanoate synthesis repressor PhaR, partial [Candidatus Thiodiazotropha taylori]
SNSVRNMSDRLIKKYPNRRLYDTEQSKYITLSQLRQLIVGGELIKVIDSTTEEDITRTILLQIILESESGGKPLFTANMLSQIIRFYGGTLQGIFGNYLEQSLGLFTAQQEQIRKNMGEDPFTAMTNLAQNNMKLWTDMQKDFFSAAGFSSPKKEEKEQ